MERWITTRAGRRRLERTLDDALRRYDEVVASNPEAAESGDTSVWHDNFAYEENQRQMHQWSRRIRDLRSMLASAEIVTPPQQPTRAQVGTTVRLLDLDSGDERAMALAGCEDGDPVAGRVSYTAPLGRALVGAEVGDLRTVRLAGGEKSFEILSIHPTPEE